MTAISVEQYGKISSEELGPVGPHARTIAEWLEDVERAALALATRQAAEERRRFRVELYLLCAGGRERLALLRLLKRFELDLRSGEFQHVDALLGELDPERLSPSVVLGALTMTYPASNQLARRGEFVASAERSLHNRLGADRAAALLQSRR